LQTIGVSRHQAVVSACNLAPREVHNRSGVTANSVLPGPTRSRSVGVFVQDMARADGKTSSGQERVLRVTLIPTRSSTDH